MLVCGYTHMYVYVHMCVLSMVCLVCVCVIYVIYVYHMYHIHLLI